MRLPGMTDSTAPIPDWVASLLHFWFAEVGEQGWWGHDPAIDALCADRWLALWAEKRSQPAETFLARADAVLAAIILFDQMPRNMFRGAAQAFATDPLARAIAHGAVALGFDIQIGGAGQAFFYMPFMHSEALEDQALSVRLFDALGDARSLDFARRHHDIIARYGRFPHRNAVLRRESRPEEQDAVEAGAGW